jgi:hypothetical protein
MLDIDIAFIFRWLRKLLKVTISFVMSVRVSVRPSVRKEQLGSHWEDFHEIWYMNIFRKSVGKIKITLKPDKNNGCFTWKPIHVFDHISLSLIRMRRFVENINAHVLCSIPYFQNPAV